MPMHIENLIEEVLKGYNLRLEGIHGIPHWRRVRDNGLFLAERTGADAQVVELFSVYHDCRRLNDGHDPGHGARGAQLAVEMRGEWFEIEDEPFEHLLIACRAHTAGLTEAHPTVQTCWDADRLDLGRVGVMPRAERLCTEAAKDPETIKWALARSWSGWDQP
ncbi:MAG: hypothetical protein CMJ86_00125 [Planctomycetes bacterium]|nr:hypothetical protein [Planctomycetota bacterium]